MLINRKFRAPELKASPGKEITNDGKGADSLALLNTIPKPIFFFFLSHVSLTISELVSKLFTGYMSSM